MLMMISKPVPGIITKSLLLMIKVIGVTVLHHQEMEVERKVMTLPRRLLKRKHPAMEKLLLPQVRDLPPRSRFFLPKDHRCIVSTLMTKVLKEELMWQPAMSMVMAWMRLLPVRGRAAVHRCACLTTKAMSVKAFSPMIPNSGAEWKLPLLMCLVMEERRSSLLQVWAAVHRCACLIRMATRFLVF